MARLPSPEEIATLADPVEQYRAARSTARALLDAYETAELEAGEGVIAAHGSMQAAADAVGISRAGFTKRMHTLRGRVRSPQPAPASGPAPDQPAIRYDGTDDAEDALAWWRRLRDEAALAGPSRILGALAVGVTPARAAALTGLSAAEIRSLRPPGNIAVSPLPGHGRECYEPLYDFARGLTRYAAACLRQSGAGSPDRVAAFAWAGFAQTVVEALATSGLPGELGIDGDEFAALADGLDPAGHPDPGAALLVSSAVGRAVLPHPAASETPDVFLAGLCEAYGAVSRQAGQRVPAADADGDHEEAGAQGALAAVFGEMAAAVRELRATGQAPVLPGPGSADPGRVTARDRATAATAADRGTWATRKSGPGLPRETADILMGTGNHAGGTAARDTLAVACALGRAVTGSHDGWTGLRTGVALLCGDIAVRVVREIATAGHILDGHEREALDGLVDCLAWPSPQRIHRGRGPGTALSEALELRAVNRPLPGRGGCGLPLAPWQTEVLQILANSLTTRWGDTSSLVSAAGNAAQALARAPELAEHTALVAQVRDDLVRGRLEAATAWYARPA